MLSDQAKRLRARKRFAELAAMAPAKEKDCESGAAAYLITKTRKIIAASNRAICEAEAVLKRR
jgi:hypothetical protein